MAFRRKPDSPPAPTPPVASRASSASVAGTGSSSEAPKSSATTVVAAGSKIVGVIGGTAEILVEGEVEGDIELERNVVVGRSGKVTGNIVARSARIAGQLIGNVSGHERVELVASASLEGDVAAPRVVIAEGAFFKGNIQMSGKAQEGSTAGVKESMAAGKSQAAASPSESEREPAKG